MIRTIKREWFIFALAVQFMTRIPLAAGNAYTDQRLAAATRYYPTVGFALGGIAALAYWLAMPLLGTPVAVLLSMVTSMLITGALHEDGLADTFDGMGGGRDRQRVLEIMKDSRIGVFGMLALTLVLALKLVTLAALPPGAAIIALIVAHGLSRLSSVIVIANSKYVRIEGLGKPTADGIGKAALTFAVFTGLIAVGLVYQMLSSTAALAVLIGAFMGHVLSRSLFEKRIGGYTGDCLGATQQITEVTIYLALLASQSVTLQS